MCVSPSVDARLPSGFRGGDSMMPREARSKAEVEGEAESTGEGGEVSEGREGRGAGEGEGERTGEAEHERAVVCLNEERRDEEEERTDNVLLTGALSFS